jgi:hypothetical protein
MVVVVVKRGLFTEARWWVRGRDSLVVGRWGNQYRGVARRGEEMRLREA